MGINKKILSKWKLQDGRECRVELTISNKIHIHIGDLQLYLTIDEFLEFSEVILEGRRKLEKIKETSE